MNYDGVLKIYANEIEQRDMWFDQWSIAEESSDQEKMDIASKWFNRHRIIVDALSDYIKLNFGKERK